MNSQFAFIGKRLLAGIGAAGIILVVMAAVTAVPMFARAVPGEPAASAAGVAVVAVPWRGDPNLPHQVVSGSSLTLQAVAMDPTTGNAVTLTSATWDPGDGTAPQSVPYGTSLNLELVHTYSGSVGQPFTATITVMSGGVTYSDQFKVVIGADTRDTKVNMAIDKALWNLHKRINRTTLDGLPVGYWTGYYNYYQVATASVVQAFEINNHRESGDTAEDPYVFDVARGLRYILSSAYGPQRIDVPLQNGNNPDANGNAYGLAVSPSNDPSYINGQIMDAIVASGTPDKTAETGVATYVRGRKYRDIIQDMLDGYSYGMADDRGGWYYTYQGTSGNNDTSASHWWAIGVLAARVWGMDAPAWVKNIQWNVGVPLMQVNSQPNNCYFGYTNNSSYIWDAGTNVTAAGLILMNADDAAQTHWRFTCASGYLAGQFNNSIGNFYTMYQTAKAMRTALNADGVTSPIKMLYGTIDWYARYADWLMNNQNTYGTGEFRANYSYPYAQVNSYMNGDMATAWGTIILSPSLFDLPTVASCSATPVELPTHGGLVTFDGSGSTPPANVTITSYSWNFDDGTAVGTGETTTHTFGNPGTWPTTRDVTLTVTDSRGLTSTATCPVTIKNTNVAPTAVMSSTPYSMCLGSTTPLMLNGSASNDQDGTITNYEWRWGSPMTTKVTGAIVDATAQFTAIGAGTHNLGLRVTDNDGATGDAFGTVTVYAATDPHCNQPPVAVADTASTFSGTPVAIPVLANDTDPDVPAQTLTVTSTTAPGNGAASTNGTTVTYTPVNGFAGTDTFNYSISDGHGGTATATVRVTVTKRDATVAAANATKVYGEADPTLTATSTGFQPGDNITVTATRAAGNGVGSYTITPTASGAALANYNVTYVNGTFTITKKAAIVTADAKSKTYGDANPALTAAVSGTVGSDTLNYTLATTATQTSGVGSYPITVTLGSNPNYTVTPTNALLAVVAKAATVVADAKNKTYGNANPPLTATVNGTVGSDTLNYALATTAVQASGVGTYPITVTLGSNPNYSVTKTDSTLTVGARPVTVAAEAKTKTYGNDNPTLTAVVTGTATGGDAVNYTLATTATSTSNVGAYPITVTLGSNPNYSVTKTDSTLTIGARPVTVAAEAKTRTYGDDNPVLTAVVTGIATGGDAVNYSLETTATSTSNVGSYPITVTLSNNPNYSVTKTGSTLTVDARPVTVVADAKAKTYGDDNPALTAVVSGTATGGDGVNYSLETTATSTSIVGSYPITVTLGNNPNYAVNKTDNTLTINQRAATVDADAKSKIYGEANPTLTATVAGTVNGDAIAYSLATTATETSGVGSYQIKVTLDSNPNYSVTKTDSTLTVRTRPLTVTADPKSKTYGETNPTLTATVVGTANADVIDYTLATTATQTSGVGSYPITVTLGSNPNYTVTPTDGTLAVIAKAATVTADPKSKVYGDVNPTLTATTVGTVNGDTIAYSLATTADTRSGIGAYAISVTLGSNPNYTVTPSDGTLTITQAALLVVTDSKSRSHSAPNPPLTGSITGLVAGDIVKAEYSTYEGTNWSPTASNTYPIVVKLNDAGGRLPNYAIRYVDGFLTLTNAAPDCSAALPSTAVIWPANHQWFSINVNGVIDVDNDTRKITIDSISQDEPVNGLGDGDTAPDGAGIGTSVAQVRAERAGTPKAPGNGRVYYIKFTADDGFGLSCSATLQVGVPHDQSVQRRTPFADGPLFNSVTGVRK